MKSLRSTLTMKPRQALEVSFRRLAAQFVRNCGYLFFGQ
jgi:hypothetical protein